MFEFLDSVDVEQPHFYLRPCTRCLKCGAAILPCEQRDGRNFWSCSCHSALHGPKPTRVGLGAKNQVTEEIKWLQKFLDSKKWGTPLEFHGIGTQEAEYFLLENWDGHSCGCEWDECECERLPRICRDCPSTYSDYGFTLLSAAILYYRRFYPREELRVDSSKISHHELLEALLPPVN